MISMKRFAAVAAVVGLVLVGASCTDEGDSSAGGSSGSVDVQGAWARTSPSSSENGAAYMVLTSDTDDALVGASTSGDIAETVQIHETVMADDTTDSDMGDMDSADSDTTETTAMGDMDSADSDTTETTAMGDMGGAMTMQEVSSIPLPAGEAVALEPGGYHVMLLGLVAPLESGQTFTLTLDFEDGSQQDVEVEVRDDAP